MDTDERLAAYKSALQDIRDLKVNQWRLSHYGLLIQAALAGAESAIGTAAPSVVAGAFSIVSLVVFCVVIEFISEAQGKIVQWRRATNSLQDRRDDTMVEWAHKFGPTDANQPCRPWEKDKKFRQLFFSVQVAGMVLAIIVMWFGRLAGCS